MSDQMLTAAESEAVDAFIHSPENLEWERRVVAGWNPSPSGYELHKARIADRDRALRSAASAKRLSAKMQRVPAWADLAAIKAVYAEARALTKASGVSHHVDHILPLQGRLVSGLHVHTNLQILTGSENCRKNNRYEV